MKVRVLASLSSLALVALLNTSVHGSPIQYTATVAGAPEIWSWITLPVDLVQGGSSELGSPALAPISTYGSLEWSTRSIPLDGNAAVIISAKDPADPTKYLGSVDVAVPIVGSISGNGVTSNLGGGYSGTGVLAADGSLPGVTPAPLLDLVSHPDRVHLSAYVTGGHMSYLLTTLSIDPPVQVFVPEPSVLATLLLGLGGLAWHHRRRA